MSTALSISITYVAVLGVRDKSYPSVVTFGREKLFSFVDLQDAWRGHALWSVSVQTVEKVEQLVLYPVPPPKGGVWQQPCK